MGVIAYLFLDYSQTMLVNGAPDVCEWTDVDRLWDTMIHFS